MSARDQSIALVNRLYAEVAALRAERDALDAQHTKTAQLLEQYVNEAHTLRAEVERLRDLVRKAFNEGFIEGCKEHTPRGGNTWIESKSRAALEPKP